MHHLIEAPLALAAGTLTILSPCVLPMLPILLGSSVAGRSANSETRRQKSVVTNPAIASTENLADGKNGQQTTASVGARPIFVLAGFVLAFCSLGMLLALVSEAATWTHEAVRNAALAILLVSGLMRIWPNGYDALMAHIDLSFPVIAKPAGPGNGGGFLLGVSLGAIWTPCAVPVLAIAYGGQLAVVRLRRWSTNGQRIQQLFGVAAVLAALTLYFHYDITITSWLLSSPTSQG